MFVNQSALSWGRKTILIKGQNQDNNQMAWQLFLIEFLTSIIMFKQVKNNL
jgi:hypothetical protein